MKYKNDYDQNNSHCVDVFEEAELVDIIANKQKLAELQAKEKFILDKENSFLVEGGV